MVFGLALGLGLELRVRVRVEFLLGCRGPFLKARIAGHIHLPCPRAVLRLGMGIGLGLQSGNLFAVKSEQRVHRVGARVNFFVVTGRM